MNLRKKRKPKVYPAQDNFPSDLDYLEAMVILNMAEDGYFLTDGHQVFERLDNINQERYDENEDISYYDDDFLIKIASTLITGDWDRKPSLNQQHSI